MKLLRLSIVLMLVIFADIPPTTNAQTVFGPSYPLMRSQAPKTGFGRDDVRCTYFFLTTLGGATKPLIYFWYMDPAQSNAVQNPTPHPDDIQWRDDEARTDPAVAKAGNVLVLEMSADTHSKEASCLIGVTEVK